MATKKKSPKMTKTEFLDRINEKYFVPASAELRKGIEKGILPKNCVVLWNNDATIEALKYAKKMKG